jgi:hypothetical protein
MRKLLIKILDLGIYNCAVVVLKTMQLGFKLGEIERRLKGKALKLAKKTRKRKSKMK